MKKTKLSKEYKLANIAGTIGVLFYGVMVFLETLLKYRDMGGVAFLMCAGTALVLIFVHLIMKNNRFVPLVTGVIIFAIFIVGASVTRNFDYYYIAMLCIFGIVCLYQRFKMVLLYFLLSIAANAVLFFTLFPQADYVNLNFVLISALLFAYGTFFLVTLSYRATSRESKADKGLRSFSSLLSSTPNYTVIIDGEARITYMSESMARFADIDPVLAVGQPLLDIFIDDNVRMMFADIIDTDGFFNEVRRIDIGANPHFYNIICDELHGDIGGIYIDITDVTQTVQSRNEAEQAKEAAEHAKIAAEHANESKSKFLATMSHEIRTPMNAIIGIAQMQLQSGKLTDAQSGAIQKIFSSGQSLLGIINDILDLSKIESGKLEIEYHEYDVPSLINDTIQLNIIRIASKPIEFVLELDENLPARLYGDELRIKQILNNLLSNAFKYTASGKITLSVKPMLTYDENATDSIAVIFKVSDTGQGMKPEQLKMLFDEYSRFNAEANRATEGTGLGMSITKKLVSLMRGSIEVESVFGKGSTFTVSIVQNIVNGDRIGRELAEKLRNFEFGSERLSTDLQFTRENMSYGRVLIVDDVETNLYVAEGLMSPYGLKIETATSGFAAIDKVKNGSTYDIILMDHMMPEMDGIETTQKLRELGYTKPIVALTANAITGNEQMFKANGFDEFISKPIDVRLLNSLLNTFVRDAHTDSERVQFAEQPVVSPERPSVSPALLEVFRRDAAKSVITLKETSDSGDLKLFAITAHAMKSACANVGETELSKLAEKLESAAKLGDEAFVTANTNALIEGLSAFAKPAEELFTSSADGDPALLAVQLQKIAAACDEFDEGAALAAVDLLLKTQLSPATKATLTEIRSAIFSDSDFDKAKGLCVHFS
ncbi:hypothetical protein FACS189490_02130 [Clostridia bacterium]|nr:hypothetical protein FACS189490_02130 [Clostridia bacterium]